MRPLSTSALLRIWETGYNEPAYRRALLLLAGACPEESADALARLTIGTRDARLLTLREWTFGPRLVCVVACPACGERLEITVNASDIRATAPESVGDEFNLELDEYGVAFRLPSSIDLQAASSCVDSESVRALLIKRCIRSIRRRDEEIGVDQSPTPVMEAVINRMAELDPQADTQLLLTCSACNHHWHTLFDIVSFFWSEIQAWASQVLREVHILASAYGWREEDILAMSPIRRQLYLGMARA